MDWLSFKKYKAKFCFIYNKSDGLSEVEKTTNLAYMIGELDADTESTTKYHEEDGTITVMNMNINLGFPKNATYHDIAESHDQLIRAAINAFPKERIPVNKSSCTIL